MNTRRSWLLGSLTVCVIATALSFGLQRKTAVARAEALALARRRAAVATEVSQLRVRGQILGARVEEVKALAGDKLAGPTVRGPADRHDGGPSTYGTAQLAKWQAKRNAALRADPQLQLLYTKRSRSFFVQEFGPF